MNHWIIDAVRRAGMAGADAFELSATTASAAAWDQSARAFGITVRELAARLGPAMGLRVADLDAAESRALALLPERLARRYHVYPLREDDRTITVATSDPTNIDVEQGVSFASARRTVFELAPPGVIGDAINVGYSPDHAVEQLLGSVSADIADAVRVVEDTAPEMVAVDEAASGPVVKLTSLIIRDAVLSRASDVHIEPGPKGGAVRLRVDGVLRVHMQLPMGALNRIVSRVKVLAKLDIADRLRPQDGRARVSVNGRTYDLRVSTVPTREAEKAVIRVLRPDTVTSLHDASLPARELEQLRHLMGFREGIMLVTGPTGSGKTTTLYAALREVASGNVNVVTVEDPVEYELAGITQIQVEEKRGMTFASALRAILRQDPDVILVGEIRDQETAEIAVQAALTGHLVLATLHTNDAWSAVTRLEDLGLGRASIASSLRGSLAQRLVRRVCAKCVQPVGDTLLPDEARLAALYGVRPTARAMGCEACGNTGYRGRLPIVEVTTVSPALVEHIAAGATVSALQRAAVTAGMRTLRDVALERVRAGETTLQEVERVVGEAGEPGESAAPPRTPRVLVVDDDKVLRTVATKVLTDAGYRADTAGDGAIALRAITDAMNADGGGDEYQLVILDQFMPQMDGPTLLAHLRSVPATAALPIIVLTSDDDHAAEARMMDAGADDYIRKPLDPSRLITRVRAALRRANL